MAGAMAHYAYISDDGNTYRLRGDISNNLTVGNTPAATGPNIPHGYHPRYVLATHPTTGRERRLVIGDPANALFVGSDSSVDLVDFSVTPSATTTYAVLSRVGERRLNQ
jgi:hypothetical protein